jgi:hypothetical protein
MKDYRSQAEIDELFGSNSESRPSLRLEPDHTRRELAAADALPGSDELSQTQFASAVQRLHEDTSSYPRYPWRELAEIAGPMCPEDLIIVAARTGGGKSLFLQNLFDALVCAGRIGLYVGLEQGPDVLRIKWACLRRDVPPKLVLATPDEKAGSPEWRAAMDAVQEELKWQREPAMRVRAHFASTRKINAKKLQTWTEWAVDHGAEFVMVDHIDRVHHGDGRNPFHEISETIRLAKELAAEHRITIILASQVGRPGDALEQFMPPALHNLRGAGTKEEEADTVLGIYRPLRIDVTDQELKAVRQGLKLRDSVLEPNTMGVMLLKHRLDGPQAGKMVKLSVRHQRVSDLQERDRWTTQYPPRQLV